MKEKIRKAVGKLKGNYYGIWAFAIIFSIAAIGGFLPIKETTIDDRFTYITQCIGILITLALIPSGLRLFQFELVKKIKELPLEKALRRYLFWNRIRLALLALPIVINFAFYICTSNNTFLFCGAMALIATFFCIPSEERMKNELDLPEEIND